MCQLFVACSIGCPYFERTWHPRLLSCPTARDIARRSSRPSEIHPCGSVSTLWNEDLCPYCLTEHLSKGASKYVRGMLAEYPLRYTPVDGKGGRYMRWSGRARQEFDIEWRMENRGSRKAKGCCGDKGDCKCHSGGRGMSNGEYLLEKARQRSWFGRKVEAPAVKREKETRYDCRLERERKETEYVCKPERKRVETEYVCRPKKETKESYYRCKPAAVTERYYTTTSLCGTKVYYETAKERSRREKEEDHAYERRMYRRKGCDIEAEVEREVREPRKKSVSFAPNDRWYESYAYA